MAILLLHAPLLRLPFFWDEAGYYVPAAYDLAHGHAVIPTNTLDAGHPPLSAAYLALWFTLSGWKPAVARIAMLLMAALALTNVFLLARRVAGVGVAVASTLATAFYPVFFVQSSLTHADLTAAAFTLWGLRLGVERRLWLSQCVFSLAVLSKETAVITPVALAAWELFFSASSATGPSFLSGVVVAREEPGGKYRRAAIRLVPVLPIAGWLLYHYLATGRLFGNAAFYQYNVVYAMNPLRFILAVGLRCWHLLGFMNMLALTAAAGVALWFPPVQDDQRQNDRKNARQDARQERAGIAFPLQIQFALIMLAHVVTFSLLGGALLTRYLLPAYPLAIMMGISTLRRRISRWEWPAAMVVLFFALGLFFDPPYKFAPEDNLTYRDYVELHVLATRFLEQHEQGATVLTAWPASDELSQPRLGYAQRPFPTLPVKNFSLEEMEKARQMRGQYQVAYLFSTKYEQRSWFRSRFWDKLNQRYFDYHQDISPELAESLLKGKIVFRGQKKAEWVAILEIEEPGAAARASPRTFPPP